MIVSQHCYEAALHITIAVDIALGRLDGSMSCQQLNVSK
jgi:hypothetical protein